MVVSLFDTPFYPYGIQLAQKWDRKIVLTLNARNEHDRSKFVEDLKESIAEMDEMEALRLESELEKQRLSMADNRDSGLTEESSVTASDILMRSSSGVTGKLFYKETQIFHQIHYPLVAGKTSKKQASTSPNILDKKN